MIDCALNESNKALHFPPTVGIGISGAAQLAIIFDSCINFILPDER
jgi:hypothetical protein